MSNVWYGYQIKMKNENNMTIIAPAVLPDGNGGWSPCPELLTEEEAVRYLRLDTLNTKEPRLTLRHYRQQRKLKATKIGKRLLYSRKALDDFIEEMTDYHNRK